MPTTIVLFHTNLRTDDNRALHWAAERGAVVPLFVRDEKHAGHPPGGASRWWLAEALKDLSASLHTIGAALVLRTGDTETILFELIKETGADAVAWNRRYEPHAAGQDEKLAASLKKKGITVSQHEGFLLFDPSAIRTGGGTPFKVFTPFSKACLSAPTPAPPVTAPKKLQGIANVPGDKLEDWKLVPKTAKWPKGLADDWEATEAAAHERLADFLNGKLAHYKAARDRPDTDGTSRLSPYLHFGQISPHRIWHAVHQKHAVGQHGSSTERYLLELLWREFSWHLLHQFPALPTKPLVPSFAAFKWHDDQAGFAAWTKGLTGYPIVDAGMRQLWQTGWMHNRVRMITASFLIKDLLIDWRKGEEWFWDTLVDADLGSNSASWQWVAGCGADAAPFFRIFNPILQGLKFDPDGAYVRRFVPELAKLPNDYIHEPWNAPPETLAKAGITLGKTYPKPILDHAQARQRALTALGDLKGEKAAKNGMKDMFDT